MNLNKLRDRAYGIARSKGFHDKPVNTPTRLCLIHSEVSEAMEADRKGYLMPPGFDPADLLRVENDEEFNELFKRALKDTFDAEMADIVIRVLDLCGAENIDIESVLLCVMRANSLRPHMHGGKAY